jgi:GTP-binding protein HflX
VINGMLKPSVYNTLRDYFPRETQIWDKIDLILHIFEKHAHTKEAKLQIEYAKIKYELPRLK